MKQLCVLSILITTILFNGASPAHTASLRAGAGKASITPSVESQPTQLGGYGDRNGRPAIGVRDPAMARAIALEDDKTRFVLVSCDLVMVPRDLKENVLARLADTGLTSATLFMAGTHTHAAPEGFAMHRGNIFKNPKLGVFDAAQLETVTEGAAAAIRQALGQMEPCRIGVGSAEALGFNRNRRGEESTDPLLTVLKILRADGTPLAGMFHFACHPTLMGPETMTVSAGWPGEVCRAMEERTGAVVMYFNGAEGDQGPRRPPLQPHADAYREWAKQFMQVARFGQNFAPHVERLWDEVSPEEKTTIQIICQSQDLPEQTLHPLFSKVAGVEYGISDDALKQMIGVLFPPRYEMIAFRIGDLTCVGIPGEPAAILGLNIKENLKRAGAKESVVIGLANDYIGYMLTPQAYEAGGYEATVSFYGPELGPLLVKQASQLSQQLWTSQEE